MAKKNLKNNSIALTFAKKGIFYYYTFFWLVLISYLFFR